MPTKKLRVEPFSDHFGITDGDKWFFYAYPSFEEAASMLKHFEDPEKIRVNISYSNPVHLLQPGSQQCAECGETGGHTARCNTFANAQHSQATDAIAIQL